jgi:hypothetical protein
VADHADVRSSFAFAPMRLKERDGRQIVSLNPFGTLHGHQLDYGHLGGNGVGTEFATIGSSAVRPNGPSYNGMHESFSLLIAPYTGDPPPARLRADAEAFFHPPATVVLIDQTPRLPVDLRLQVEERREATHRERITSPPAPLAFLANPSSGAVDLVWDEPQGVALTGYEFRWRKWSEASEDDVPEWNTRSVGICDRHRIDGLANGEKYAFQMRALAARGQSPWTDRAVVEVGPVPQVGVTSIAREAPFSLLLRTFWYALVHALTTP